MSYTHLSHYGRYQIYTMHDLLSVAEIAQRLGRHESTIRRELVSKRGWRGYRPKQSQVLAEVRSIGNRNAVCISPVIWAQALDFLRVQHSQDQIVRCLRISHEIVYQRVYDDSTGELKGHLRCQKKRKKRYARGASRKGQIPNRRRIEGLSAAVETRKHIGQWEADTVIGAAQKGALVELKSGMLLIEKVDFSCVDLVNQVMIGLLTPVKQMVATMTYDNSNEFAMYESVNTAIGCESFFADPYRSGLRETNENTNGLIRQHAPKGIHLSTLSDEEVQLIQDKLNHRPRKRLGFKTLHQVFYTSIHCRTLRA